MKKVICVVNTHNKGGKDTPDLEVGSTYHVVTQYTKDELVKLKWTCGHTTCLLGLYMSIKEGIWYSLQEMPPNDVYHSSAFADLPDPVEETEDVERELEIAL